jgi:hypothetical protein
MLRVFLTIVLPLAAPTALYLAWVWYTHYSPWGSQPGSQPGEAVRWAGLPWVWLAGAGALLLALVLFVVTVNFRTAPSGVYVPPRTENGRIIPGHVEPGRSP